MGYNPIFQIVGQIIYTIIQVPEWLINSFPKFFRYITIPGIDVTFSLAPMVKAAVVGLFLFAGWYFVVFIIQKQKRLKKAQNKKIIILLIITYIVAVVINMLDAKYGMTSHFFRQIRDIVPLIGVLILAVLYADKIFIFSEKYRKIKIVGIFFLLIPTIWITYGVWYGVARSFQYLI